MKDSLEEACTGKKVEKQDDTKKPAAAAAPAKAEPAKKVEAPKEEKKAAPEKEKAKPTGPIDTSSFKGESNHDSVTAFVKEVIKKDKD